MRIPMTNRLLTAAQMIGKADTLCDVGCDHGYLPIYLLQTNQIHHACACDLRDGPLQRAEKNIRACHLSDRITTVKSDGLRAVGECSYDVISICGMGGRLIAEILSRDLAAAHRAKRLVLQPMSEIPVLRKFLCEHGFVITEERLALEDRRFYILIGAATGEEEYREEIDHILGRKLLMGRDDLTLLYLQKEIRRYSAVLSARGGPERAPKIARILCELKKYINN